MELRIPPLTLQSLFSKKSLSPPIRCIILITGRFTRTLTEIQKSMVSWNDRSPLKRFLYQANIKSDVKRHMKNLDECLESFNVGGPSTLHPSPGAAHVKSIIIDNIQYEA